jgi:hypothetical protein
MTTNALGIQHHTSASNGTPSFKRPRVSGPLPHIGVVLFLASIG